MQEGAGKFGRLLHADVATLLLECGGQPPRLGAPALRHLPHLQGSRQILRIQPHKLRQHEQPILPHQHPVEPDLSSAPLGSLDEH